MNQDIVQTIISGGAVFVGLFVLWSFVGDMRRLPAGQRALWALVVNGFVKDVLQQLPMEFAVEAQKLISISLEGSVG